MNPDDKTIAPVDPATVTPASVDEPKGTDYQVELERTKKRLEQSEFTNIELKRKLKESGEGKIDTAEIRALAAEEAEAKTKEQMDAFRLEQAQGVMEMELSRLTNDPAKRDLIKLHYEKSIIRSGYTPDAIRNDLINALALTERPTVEKTLTEMRTTMATRHTMAPGSTTGQTIDSPSADNFTPEEKKFMSRYGVTEKDLNK